MTTYDVGDQLKLAASFTNSAGAAADPTTVTFKHKDPSGNTATLVYGTDAEVVKTGTGGYYVLLTLDEAGTWYVRWAGTGAIIAAVEQAIGVKESAF